MRINLRVFTALCTLSSGIAFMLLIMDNIGVVTIGVLVRRIRILMLLTLLSMGLFVLLVDALAIRIEAETVVDGVVRCNLFGRRDD